MINFLESLDQARIPYVSWKNNHELSIALAGNSDLDIFVPLRFRVEFLTIASGSGWIRLENPVARYPWVTHLYKLGDDLQEFHLHVYFKLVTGESWLKEYVLPFDEMLIAERQWSADSAVWELNNTAQAYLFALRHLLKGGSFLSRVLYRREIVSYQNEWNRCQLKVDALHDWGPVKLNDYIPGSGLQGGEVCLPKFHNAVLFRLSLLPFLRFSCWSLPLWRIQSLTLRSFNKLIYKRKKIFPESGLILAISGVDGAGKSTMLDEIDRVFSRFLTIRRFALGRPQGSIMEAMRRLLRRGRSGRELLSPEKETSAGTSPPSILSSVSAPVLALLRLRMARKAMKCALEGHLALVDRWPTDSTGMMDGPRLNLDASNSSFTGLCAFIERWAYSRMPRADICFFLEAPESILVARNQNRLKVGKETDEEIMARAQHNQQFKPLALKVVHFDNNGPLEQKRKELLLRIWEEMAAV